MFFSGKVKTFGSRSRLRAKRYLGIIINKQFSNDTILKTRSKVVHNNGFISFHSLKDLVEFNSNMILTICNL